MSSAAAAAPSASDLLTQIGTEVSADVTAVIADGKALLQRAETNVVQDVVDGYAWLKSELAKLEPQVLEDLKTDLSKALSDAMAGGSTAGSITADVLTLLSNQGSTILNSVESSVITALIGIAGSTIATL